MATTREYLIKPDGAICRRVVTESEIDINDALLSLMVRDVNYKVPNVAYLDKAGWLGIATLSGHLYATISLERLVIRAPWMLLPSRNVLVPNFGSRSDPVVSVRWTPPEGCTLRFVMQVMPGPRISGTGRSQHKAVGFWLFAVDYRKNPPTFHRLPIANVYEDCSCCMGHEGIYGLTLLQAVQASLDNFDQSLYNSDLWKDAELTQKLFQVKPIANGGFEPVAPETDWVNLCPKIANATTAYLV